MKCSRQLGWRLSPFVLLALAGPAHATINMSGGWVLLFAFFISGPQPATFVQTGTTLSVTLLGDTLTGTIDTATGAFTLSDNVACSPPLTTGPTTLAGTVAANGLTFSATWEKGEGIMCHPASTPVTGSRPCTDDTMCDPCSACDLGLSACVSSPGVSCRAPTVFGAAPLTLTTRRPKLSWKWVKGEGTTLADFGDPVHTDAYALCLYDESGSTPNTLFRATVPPGAGWRAAGQNGFAYKNKVGVAGGVTGIRLKAGADSKAKIVVAASGPHLLLPALPLPLPLTVQLRGHGECWDASYLQGRVKKNTASEFVAKSSPSGAFLDH